VPQPILLVNQDKGITVPPPPLFEQPGYFHPSLDFLRLAKPHLHRVGDRQALAAFGPPGAQYLAAVGRGHPRPETVLVGPLPVGRLKCPLHGTTPFNLLKTTLGYKIYIIGARKVKVFIFILFST
jgi:hypothetical protein